MKRLAFQLGLYAAMAWSLGAQTVELRANVPFPFHIGRTALPAGEYRIYNTGSALAIRDEDGGHSAVMFLTVHDVRLKPAADSVLAFNRYGSTYFLSGIWTAGSSEGHVIPPSREEKQLARQSGTPEKTGVAIARR